jgi:hypothetical protein
MSHRKLWKEERIANLKYRGLTGYVREKCYVGSRGVSVEKCRIVFNEGGPSDRLGLVVMGYQLVKTAVLLSCSSPYIHFYDAVVIIS